MAKDLILDLILVCLAKIWAPKFFSQVLPLPNVINSCNVSLSAISRKTNEPNLRKWQKKPSFGPDFGPPGPNLGPKTFFLKFYLY